ncbi:radical SAM/SPASM domain-containing protein [Streptomyces luteireticuli]|uniref:Radical SAM protein n=1 Tax=Streptomyces luteireticuli TaxID=173858 RepID=A0ABP3ITE0_9ACTN
MGLPNVDQPLAGLRYVEIETSRYCNRVCSWCPNGHTTERRAQELMPWDLFTKITRELGAAGFGGFFAFHNYNEPLHNKRLPEEIAEVRTTVPKAKPAIYTNGDRFNREVFEQMQEGGVSYVRVTRYPPNATIVPTYGYLQRWIHGRELSGLGWEYGPVRQGLAATWTAPGGSMKVEVIRPQITTYNDRGGTAVVPTELPTRTAPCQMTATSLSVDYMGRMKMCCNVIPQGSVHQEYVVGSAADQPLTELWNHEFMAEWRKRHAQADWSRSPACRTCVQQLPETRR